MPPSGKNHHCIRCEGKKSAERSNTGYCKEHQVQCANKHKLFVHYNNEPCKRCAVAQKTLETREKKKAEAAKVDPKKKELDDWLAPVSFRKKEKTKGKDVDQNKDDNTTEADAGEDDQYEAGGDDAEEMEGHEAEDADENAG